MQCDGKIDREDQIHHESEAEHRAQNRLGSLERNAQIAHTRAHPAAPRGFALALTLRPGSFDIGNRPKDAHACVLRNWRSERVAVGVILFAVADIRRIPVDRDDTRPQVRLCRDHIEPVDAELRRVAFAESEEPTHSMVAIFFLRALVVTMHGFGDERFERRER